MGQIKEKRLAEYMVAPHKSILTMLRKSKRRCS